MFVFNLEGISVEDADFNKKLGTLKGMCNLTVSFSINYNTKILVYLGNMLYDIYICYIIFGMYESVHLFSTSTRHNSDREM